MCVILAQTIHSIYRGCHNQRNRLTLGSCGSCGIGPLFPLPSPPIKPPPLNQEPDDWWSSANCMCADAAAAAALANTSSSYAARAQSASEEGDDDVALADWLMSATPSPLPAATPPAATIAVLGAPAVVEPS